MRQLAGDLQETKGIVRQMDSYLLQQPAADLTARLGRLADRGDMAALLADRAALVDRYGFVEFRSPLSTLVQSWKRLPTKLPSLGALVQASLRC